MSSLDSTIRLLDKGNGHLLQAYRGHINAEYRVRGCLAAHDAFVVSGSEDGSVFVWDLLEGGVVEKLEAHGGKGKGASAVAVNDARKEWLSAGVDGECPGNVERRPTKLHRRRTCLGRFRMTWSDCL